MKKIKKKKQYKHRLKCIEEDVKVIADFIQRQHLDDEFKKTTGLADEAWHHISNIEIACDLEDKSSLQWGTLLKK
jgi:hypothetical protein